MAAAKGPGVVPPEDGLTVPAQAARNSKISHHEKEEGRRQAQNAYSDGTSATTAIADPTPSFSHSTQQPALSQHDSVGLRSTNAGRAKGQMALSSKAEETKEGGTRGSRKLNGFHASPVGDKSGRTGEKSSLGVQALLPTRDLRTRLPVWLQRWTGYRDPDEKPPHACLPIPPFTWLAKLPLKYETWALSTVGAFVGIALIEVIISAAFPNDGTILIVASYGASAVLCFGTIESPLAQPRHVIGGQVLSCILSICLTKLFRLSPHYQLSDTIVNGELNHLVWINGALAMALSLLLMQITGTVHPPGGATALIASVQPAAVNMSWRLIYVVLISGLIMTVWACIINNVGRRRYPNYWFSGTRVFVRTPKGDIERETMDRAAMNLEEGRSPWIRNMADEDNPEEAIAVNDREPETSSQR